MFTTACCLGVGLRLGLDLLSGWLVVNWLCTRICTTFDCHCHSHAKNHARNNLTELGGECRLFESAIHRQRNDKQLFRMTKMLDGRQQTGTYLFNTSNVAAVSVM